MKLVARYHNGKIEYKAMPRLKTPNKNGNMTQENNFTLQEKIESVMSMLNTPIFRRRIGNEEIIKLISEICQEMGIRGSI